MAVDFNGDVLRLVNGRWSAPASIDPGGVLIAVSCRNVRCVAIDIQGNALTSLGTRWSAPTSVDAGNNPLSLSCPILGSVTSFCAAVDSNGNVVTFNGTSWSAPLNIDSGGELGSVSCTDASFCVAVDNAGRALTFDGTSWSAPVPVDAPFSLNAVSCVSTNFCVAVGSSGNALTYDGTTWSATGLGASMWSVSCATVQFCAAIDTNGNAYINDSGTWSAPTALDPGISPFPVSCPSPRRCVAVDIDGNAFTYYGLAGGSITFSKSSGLIGNMVIRVSGTTWNVDADTAVDIYECASTSYSALTCDAANAAHRRVWTGGPSLGKVVGASITLAVGVIDPNGDTCGLAGSTACYIVMVGTSGDFSSRLLSFAAPTITLSKTAGVTANYTEKITAQHFPIGDVVQARQCDPDVTAANLSTNCDPATATLRTAGLGGGFLLDPFRVTVLVGGAYSDAATETCAPGGSCYIVLNDTTNPAITLQTQITLAP